MFKNIGGKEGLVFIPNERLRLPNVVSSDGKAGRASKTLKISNYINRDFQIGALYYIPNSSAKLPSQFTSLIPLCKIVADHGLGQIQVIDESEPIFGRSKNVKVNAKLGSKLLNYFGLDGNIEGEYQIDVKVNNARTRKISSNAAKSIRKKLSNGPDCKNEYIPSVRKNQIVQIVGYTYGDVKITTRKLGRVGILSIFNKSVEVQEGLNGFFVFKVINQKF